MPKTDRARCRIVVKLALISKALQQRKRKPATRAVAANGDMLGVEALPQQEVPSLLSVLQGSRIWMLRREPIVDGEGTHATCTTCLGDHAAVADDRTRAVPATMEEHEGSATDAVTDGGPLRGQAIDVDRLKLDVVGSRPDRSHIVKPLSPLRPTDRAWFLLPSKARTTAISLWSMSRSLKRVKTVCRMHAHDVDVAPRGTTA